MELLKLVQMVLSGSVAMAALVLDARAMPVARLEVPSLLEEAHFFENSVRADVLPAEAPFLVEIHVSGRQMAKSQGKTDDETVAAYTSFFSSRPTCSGFFVRNSLNKIYVGSSRHCFFYKAKEILADPEVTIKDFATGHVGHGVKIVAEDASSDFFIFEASFGEDEAAVRAAIKTLTLTDLTEPAGEGLAAFGFPGDAERQGRPTKSSSCATFANDYDTEKQKVYLTGYYAYLASVREGQSLSGPKSPENADIKDSAPFTAQAYIFANATMIKHNCSIYGGNSGGPMVLAELPDLVIGLPETYEPSAKIFAKDFYGFMETPRRLAKMQTKMLLSAGVNVVVLSHEDLLKEIAMRKDRVVTPPPAVAKPVKARPARARGTKRLKRSPPKH